MLIDRNEWRIVESPGYFGKKRDDVIQLLDSKHGINNWKIAYSWGNKLVSRKFALQLYEDAYMNYFNRNPDVLDWLLNNASNVFDNSATNVDSGLDYNIQEESSSHLQDISIRRIVLRLGRKFKGNRLIQVRSNNSPGYILNPGQVPFHLPEYILKNDLCPRWALPHSVEAFWQCNKVIIAKNNTNSNIE